MITAGKAKLLEYLPDKFVRFFAKKIVNGYIDKYAEIDALGLDNLKNLKRPIIFVSNHLSNSDGLVINKILKEENITFVAGVKLSQNSFTNLGRYVVDTLTIKPNTADKDAIQKTIKVLKEGKSIFIFPEGTRSRDKKMIKGKKGIVLIQKITGAEVVPIGIWGTENLLPVNIEGEMDKEKFNFSKVHVRIGEKVSIRKRLEDQSKHEYEDSVLNDIMRDIAALIPEEYRGFYQ